jgi:hypothetical protein
MRRVAPFRPSPLNRNGPLGRIARIKPTPTGGP